MADGGAGVTTYTTRSHLSPQAREVLDYIIDNPGCTSRAIETALGLSHGAVYNRVGTLYVKRYIGRQVGLSAVNKVTARWYPEPWAVRP